MRRFLFMWCRNWLWARKLYGGRWVRMKIEGADWVPWNWNYPEDLQFGGWPLPQEEFECEAYR